MIFSSKQVSWLTQVTRQ